MKKMIEQQVKTQRTWIGLGFAGKPVTKTKPGKKGKGVAYKRKRNKYELGSKDPSSYYYLL